MKQQALYFTAPEQVEVVEEDCRHPAGKPYLVRTLLSAISPGTELLFFRGQVPQEMPADAMISALNKTVRYPFKYGYCNVGEVVEVSPGEDRAWLGRKVFSFHPHESYYWAGDEDLITLPDGMPVERAVFLPNMETALNLVMDGRPAAGEFAGIFGLGIVGLLTSALLAQYPLGGIAGFDRFSLRRETALKLGLQAALDPEDAVGWQSCEQDFRRNGMPDGLDLCFEVSGAPAALNQAIRLSGYAARVVIGSWYGTKPVQLNLGGAFHRSRIQLIASQVSTIAPELSGRWSKSRRFVEAFRQLNRICPEAWISHRFKLSAAPTAYRLLNEDPASVIQLVFDY
jgi:threonine dehydrogenase-like Zn-dependent dehydrogenase